MTTSTAPDKLRLYRSRHRIQVVDDRCVTDGIRVLPKRGGGLRHHPDDLALLVKNQYAERVAFVAAPVILDPFACSLCGRGGPSHNASPRCESGGYPHCSCDVCF